MTVSNQRSRLWLLVLAIVVVLGWLVFRSPGSPDDPDREARRRADVGDERGPDLDPDDLLVDLRDDASAAEVEALSRRHGLRLALVSRFAEDERFYRAHVDPAQADRLVAALRGEPLVELAEHDRIVALGPEGARRLDEPAAPAPGDDDFPNDPQYAFQWHLRQIHMPQAWPVAAGGDVVVAVIDTGVAFEDHGRFKRVPDLAETAFVPGYDFVHKTDHPADDHGHGTHVAGTIAQSTHNGVGVAGVAFRARIMPLKVLSARGFGSVGDIAEAIRFAADHGAKVINMSLGGSGRSQALTRAVAYAHQHGVVVVCAAGNDGRGKVSYPAADPGALAVAATQYDETTTFYSNWGPEIDVAAPGGNTRVDQNGDGKPDGVLQNTLSPGDPTQSDYYFYMGTSMAAPHVAGVAALVVGQGVTQPDAVEELLEQTARRVRGAGRDDHYGAGIVDAQAALARARGRFGLYQLGLALLGAAALLVRLSRRAALGVAIGPTFLGGLVLGSSGLFFLPALGLGDGLLLTHGFPAWDLGLLGAAHHANALTYSMAAPVLAAVSLYRVRRLRGLLGGFALGVAAHLAFHALWAVADVLWIPNVLGLDTLWLSANALGAAAIAYIILRK